jgi:hypothetical protein
MSELHRWVGVEAAVDSAFREFGPHPGRGPDPEQLL